MNEKGENHSIKCLMNDLKKMEDVYEVEPPDQFQIMSTLKAFQIKQAKAWKRELTIFIFTALILIIFYLLISLKTPTVFLWIQAVGLITIPFIYSAEKKRRRDKSGVLKNGF